MAGINKGGGETVYFNNWMFLTHVAYWDAHVSDAGITGEKVSDYLTEIQKNLVFPKATNFLEVGGPFNGLRIKTWNCQRAVKTADTIDWGIDKNAGLTLNKIIKVNSNYVSNGGIYSHEFGHNLHQVCGMDGYKRLPVSKHLEAAYGKLRGANFAARTPRNERFAEDFKYFFGTSGIANIDNPDDDANHPLHPQVGRQVKWARDVLGLKALIHGASPVFNRLKDKDIVEFAYYEKDNCYKWERKTSWFTSQWEAFLSGIFYKWDGQKSGRLFLMR